MNEKKHKFKLHSTEHFHDMFKAKLESSEFQNTWYTNVSREVCWIGICKVLVDVLGLGKGMLFWNDREGFRVNPRSGCDGVAVVYISRDILQSDLKVLTFSFYISLGAYMC